LNDALQTINFSFSSIGLGNCSNSRGLRCFSPSAACRGWCGASPFVSRLP
jgi:hypothetical protein